VTPAGNFGHLFFQSHAREEIGDTIRDSKMGIFVGRCGLLLLSRKRKANESEDNCKTSCEMHQSSPRRNAEGTYTTEARGGM